ncbi:PREDICTED: putative F-box/kelch-repeat protein At3g20710 [Brassica oleracea var. oleracea]|uniref:putative F-box/kelch-repeat protein At3g20710 n=1 Tax=Brassica oleracea var. oleracea TaxID=109376 RepID=UPI0006A6DFA8|nr:PREDICTED: putative F-box/kelch-repeat protein At3g20710 [Brassica oleracea var. oleracea]
MLEEILSSVPVKSIVTVRSTCKNWNVLTEDQRFANKHIEKAAAASQREKETPPDVAFHSNVIEYTKASLTLKGNTYWHVESGDGFLHCFDFTRERFGPHLPLPSDINHRCSVSLSSVKEEKLAVLLEQTLGEFEIAVWEEKKTVVAFDDFNNWYNTYIIDGESGHSREWYRKNYLGHGFA